VRRGCILMHRLKNDRVNSSAIKNSRSGILCQPLRISYTFSLTCASTAWTCNLSGFLIVWILIARGDASLDVIDGPDFPPIHGDRDCLECPVFSIPAALLACVLWLEGSFLEVCERDRFLFPLTENPHFFILAKNKIIPAPAHGRTNTPNLQVAVPLHP